MKTTTQAHWHVAKTGNHQGLIVDDDGRNVAVSYDKADAPLIAAVPDLLAALESVRLPDVHKVARDLIVSAIAKAKGQL